MNQDTQLHIKRHQELHTALDELIGDYLCHNRGSLLTETSAMELIEWSYKQTQTPTANENNHIRP